MKKVEESKTQEVANKSLDSAFVFTTQQDLDAIGDIVKLTSLIPKNHMTLLYSPGGKGKSSLVASQIKKLLEDHKNELVYLFDFDQAIIRNRDMLNSLLKLEGFRNVPVSNNTLANTVVNTLEAQETLENKVIVIDALQGMFARFNLDINKAKDAGKIMNMLKSFRDKGATVIVIHHSNKITVEGTASFRGSAVIQDSVDNLFEIQQISRTETELTLRVVMEHKYSFLTDNPEPIFKLDKQLGYEILDKLPSEQGEVGLPRGIEKRSIPYCLDVIRENSGKTTGIVEEALKDTLGVGKNKIKAFILYLKETGIVQAVKLTGNNRFSLEVLEIDDVNDPFDINKEYV